MSEQRSFVRSEIHPCNRSSPLEAAVRRGLTNKFDFGREGYAIWAQRFKNEHREYEWIVIVGGQGSSGFVKMTDPNDEGSRSVEDIVDLIEGVWNPEWDVIEYVGFDEVCDLDPT